MLACALSLILIAPSTAATTSVAPNHQALERAEPLAPEDDAIERKLKRAVSGLEKVASKESKALLTAIEAATKTVGSSKAGAAEKLAAIQELTLQRDRFQDDPQALPTVKSLAPSVARYTRELSDAQRKFWDRLEELATECIEAGDTVRAAAILATRTERVGADRPSPKEVAKVAAKTLGTADFLRENLTGLKLHRGDFARSIEGFMVDVDTAIYAAAAGNKSLLSKSLSAAIRKARAQSVKEQGAKQARADVLAILEAIKDGDGDLSGLELYTAGSKRTKRPELRGIPGVEYDSTVDRSLERWSPGSRWSNLNAASGKKATFTVRSRTASHIVLALPSIQKRGDVLFTLQIKEDGLLELEAAKHVGTPHEMKTKNINGRGVIGSDYLVFTFTAELQNVRKGGWKTWGPNTTHLVPAN